MMPDSHEQEKQSTAAIERVRKARDANRPYTNDLLRTIFSDFTEIHGDRRFADDPALVCGFAKLDGIEVAVVGQQKGRDTNQRKFRNFGMPKPEGYRKAIRLMKVAEKFSRPVVTFIDTPGAYPGIDAEERGQAEAIAYNLREMAGLEVPVVVVILGEGGSGGALAIGIGDRILMMENAVYSVISPEGCAAILWKDASEAERAADCLRLTAEDLHRFGIVDEVIPEPTEWRVFDGIEKVEEENSTDSAEKRAFFAIADGIKDSIVRNIGELGKKSAAELRNERFQKFRRMGEWIS